jgi:hypothetical protein
MAVSTLFCACSFTMVGYYSKSVDSNIPVYDSILFEETRKYQISNIEYESKKYNVYQKQYGDFIIAVQLHNEQSLGLAGGLPFLFPMIPLGGRSGYGLEDKNNPTTPCVFVTLAIKKVSDTVDSFYIDLPNVFIYNEKDRETRPSGYCLYEKLKDVIFPCNMFSTRKYLCNDSKKAFKECNNLEIRLNNKEQLIKILLKYDASFIPQDKGRIVIPPITYKGKTINIELILFKKGTMFFYSPCCIPA